MDKEITTADSAEIDFKYYGGSDKYTILVCLNDKNKYRAELNGSPVEINERSAGIIEITLGGDVKGGKLCVCVKE